MVILWAFLFTCIVILYAYNYFTDRRARIIEKTFPFCVRAPLIGNLYLAFCTPERFYKVMIWLEKRFNYKIFIAWTHEQPFVIVADYKVAKMILSNNTEIDKLHEYKLLEPWLGQGLLTGKGEKYRKNRKLITPAFHFQILHKFFKVFNANADILCEKLSNHDGKEAFNIYPYINLYALDNICDSSMGTKVNAQKDPNSKYVYSVKKLGEVFYKRIFFPWLRPDWLFKYTSPGKEQKAALNTLHSFHNEVIQKRKSELDLSGSQNDKDLQLMFGDKKEKTAFLDLLLQIGKGGVLSDEDIRAEVDTFMFAGHDTVSSATSFVLYALAKHQDVQEKVYQEIVQIFGSSDRCPTNYDIQEMKYTEQTIKETLRMYTVIPAIGRNLQEDFPISEDKFIPKGAEVVVLIQAIHRDPEIWPNPTVFDPDRFLPEACQDRDPFAFIPFSAGTRNCIGQRFAMNQMKVTVYKILRKFKILPSDKTEDQLRLRIGMVTTSVNGVVLKVQSRKK